MVTQCWRWAVHKEAGCMHNGWNPVAPESFEAHWDQKAMLHGAQRRWGVWAEQEKMAGSKEGGRQDNACRTGLLTSEDKIIFWGQASKTPRLPPSPLLPSLLSSLNMDNDCLRLQNHKSEVPIATEQLARLPIIIIINHADFTVFSGTAGDCTGQGAPGASGTAKHAGKACRRVGEEKDSGYREGTVGGRHEWKVIYVCPLSGFNQQYLIQQLVLGSKLRPDRRRWGYSKEGGVREAVMGLNLNISNCIYSDDLAFKRPPEEFASFIFGSSSVDGKGWVVFSVNTGGVHFVDVSVEVCCVSLPSSAGRMVMFPHHAFLSWAVRLEGVWAPEIWVVLFSVWEDLHPFLLRRFPVVLPVSKSPLCC